MTSTETMIPTLYVRDLDGTGSLHVCAKGDEGAIPLYTRIVEYTITANQQKPPEQDVLKQIDDRLENICQYVFDTKLAKVRMRRFVRTEVNALADDIKALTQRQAAPDAKCKGCNGNDGDTPCAYPSGDRDGCLRDVRLGRAAPPSEVTLKCNCKCAIKDETG